MISTYYTNTFTVEALTNGTSAIGSYAPTWAEVGSFKGWFDYLSGGEQKVAAQYVGKASHVIGCSSTNSWITSKHRIRDGLGDIYRVLNVDNPMNMGHHLEIILEYNETDNLST